MVVVRQLAMGGGGASDFAEGTTQNLHFFTSPLILTALSQNQPFDVVGIGTAIIHSSSSRDIIPSLQMQLILPRIDLALQIYYVDVTFITSI